MKQFAIAALMLCSFTFVNAQQPPAAPDVPETPEIPKPGPFTFSGYIEGYYGYDSGEPSDHLRPSFLYSHNRHNEVNLNLAFVKAAYSKQNVRANLGIMAGTYAQYILAAEQDLLKHVYEANVGIKISKKHNLWIDAGILPSHIGFESAVGKDCATLTRSLAAEESVYYEAGVKLGYTSPSGKWMLSAMYLNGWQRIQRIDGNQTPAFGSQVVYKPTDKVTLNWSTYIGNEQPDSIKKWRYFNDLYALFPIAKKWNVSAGFDVGVQQSDTGTSDYDVWYTPVLITQYKPTQKIQLAARAEYFYDKQGVIVSTGTENGFRTLGFSANFDYLPADNVMLRIEARSFESKDKIFVHNDNPSSSNFYISTALAISF
jgi:hypothetical protein